MANENIYQMVTDRMTSLIESGVIPWEQPWVMGHIGQSREGRAYSRSTGRPYSLLNQFLLAKPGEYLTFGTARKLGGSVRKGEKSKPVVFWKPFIKDVTRPDGTQEKQKFFMLRYYNVFHIDQCEGITPRQFKTENKPKWEHEPIEAAEATFNGYITRSGIALTLGSDRAFYRPSADSITLPALHQYKRPEEYYSTAFHEATHSTGHKSRLNRLTEMASFGSDLYSKEELVAEMGSAFLCNILGINTDHSDRNSAAYLQSWGKALRADPKMFVSAAGKAEKAVQLIAPDLCPVVEEEAEEA